MQQNLLSYLPNLLDGYDYCQNEFFLSHKHQLLISPTSSYTVYIHEARMQKLKKLDE